MEDKQTQLEFSVHTPKLFDEILKNPGTAILRIPLDITLGILGKIAIRAIKLDDDELHQLMIRLTLYSCADPSLPDYDPKITKKYKELKF